MNLLVMRCGHVVDYDETQECFRCIDVVPDWAKEVSNPQPDLTNRIARCRFFGHPIKTGAVTAPCKLSNTCKCKEPSRLNLTQFYVRRNKNNGYSLSPEDSYYCGCQGEIK